VPYRVLDKRYAFGETEAASANKIIHGDNLEALKALLPEYEGRVDCIYIDPPYNTENEGWVYNDNVNDPKIARWLHEVVGKDGEDLSRHDKWLCMMYPRLMLLKRLLSERGSIWISIDDNEQANLKLVMDEIFGARNFIATVIWQKVYSPKNSAMYLSEDHDFIMVYANRADTWRPNLLPRTEEQNSRYANPDNDPRGVWKPGDLSARNYYSEGTYPINCPGGRVIAGPPGGNYWRVAKTKLDELDKDNRIWWGPDRNNVPAIKRFLSEVKDGLVPQTLWKYDDVGHTQEAKKELLSIMDFISSGDVFITPKPVRLIERILRIATKPDSIVLDSFAGSGTTSHAVMKLNAEDGGMRRFILVEMEDYAESLTAERVRRASIGYGEGDKAIASLGSGFSYYELGPRLFDASGESADGFSDEAPRAVRRSFIWYAETGSPIPADAADAKGPFLGERGGTAYYLFDKSFGRASLKALDTKAETHVVYAPASTLGPDLLASRNIVFKKLPRDLPVEGRAAWS
jgi:adenine-specific DNA-methyltransferase